MFEFNAVKQTSLTGHFRMRNQKINQAYQTFSIKFTIITFRLVKKSNGYLSSIVCGLAISWQNSSYRCEYLIYRTFSFFSAQFALLSTFFLKKTSAYAETFLKKNFQDILGKWTDLQQIAPGQVRRVPERRLSKIINLSILRALFCSWILLQKKKSDYRNSPSGLQNMHTLEQGRKTTYSSISMRLILANWVFFLITHTQRKNSSFFFLIEFHVEFSPIGTIKFLKKIRCVSYSDVFF